LSANNTAAPLTAPARTAGRPFNERTVRGPERLSNHAEYLSSRFGHPPEIHRLIAEIKKHNRKLGAQLEDAWSSVVLNIAEGSGVRGGHRTQRYMTALGSARETLGRLEA
jgi:hypothetical protein